jgi:hypothetical protein
VGDSGSEKKKINLYNYIAILIKHQPNMRKLTVLFLLCLITASLSMAQQRKFENLIKYYRAGNGPIMENDKLVGYYAFYMYDKADKKNDAYLLNLMDDNLNVVKSIDILRPKGEFLLETVFNGNAFCCVFYNSKKGVETITFDKAGKKLGSVLKEDLTKMEKIMLNAVAQSNNDDPANASIFPLGSAGFIQQTSTKNDKMGYAFTAYDNNMKKLWSVGSSPTSKLLESADLTFSSEDYAGVAIARKKNMMTKEFDTYISLLDCKTGKFLFEKELKGENKGEMSVLNMFFDKEKKQLALFGEYYAPGDEVLKSRSQGIFIMSYDESGNIVADKKYSWLGDIKKIAKMEGGAEAEEKDAVRVFFHKVYRTADGSVVAIGEQFKKTTSAAGLAGRALGGNASASQITIMNMVKLALAPDLSLSGYTIISKKKTRAPLPEGYGTLNPTMLSYYVKAMGGFDYEFTSSDLQRDKYYTVYKDYDREGADGKKSDVMLGIIKTEEGKSSVVKAPINIESSYFSINPAKPGFVQITEYNKKKKTLNMFLEKITF